MRELDKIKKEIANISSSMEMAGYLDGIKACAVMYCRENCPDEIVDIAGEPTRVTISGMSAYLDSELTE